ncbi:MAG: hypothetical protein ACXWXC_10795 [Aeromicrobium sp.]
MGISSNASPTTIYVDSVDDVPLLWVDAPPPYHLFLMFRVGRADEELTNSGITHLVEHLVFPHDHTADSSSNGATTLTNTVFYAWGSPDDAAAFITRVATSLSRLPLDGQPERALQIAAAAEVYAQQEGIVNVYSDQTPGPEFVDRARSSLPEEHITRAEETGRRLSIKQALDLARIAEPGSA